MKAKIIFVFMVAIYLLRGVALIFIPEKLFGMYGASLDETGNWNAQFMGWALLFIISVILAIKGAGLFNSLVWAAISLDTLLLLLFAYLLFSGNASSKRTT